MFSHLKSQQHTHTQLIFQFNKYLSTLIVKTERYPVPVPPEIQAMTLKWGKSGACIAGDSGSGSDAHFLEIKNFQKNGWKKKGVFKMNYLIT